MEELLSLLRACNEPSLGPLMAATVAEDRGAKDRGGHRCTDGNLAEFRIWQEIINSTGEIPPRLLELIQQMLVCGWVQVLRCWR